MALCTPFGVVSAYPQIHHIDIIFDDHLVCYLRDAAGLRSNPHNFNDFDLHENGHHRLVLIDFELSAIHSIAASAHKMAAGA